MYRHIKELQVEIPARHCVAQKLNEGRAKRDQTNLCVSLYKYVCLCIQEYIYTYTHIPIDRWPGFDQSHGDEFGQVGKPARHMVAQKLGKEFANSGVKLNMDLHIKGAIHID